MTPRPADEPNRPADVARRALRAARERASREAATTDVHRPAPQPAEPDTNPTAPEQPAAQASRPADVAREALRRAFAARHGAGEGGSGDVPGGPPEDPAGDISAVAPGGAADPPDLAGSSGAADSSGVAGSSGTAGLPDGGELADAVGLPDAGELPNGAERPDGAELLDMAEHPDAAERPDMANLPDAAERPDGADLPDVAPLPDRADLPDPAELPDLQEHGTAPAHGPHPAPSAPRPADVAREALRAARRERERADGTASEADSRRRARPDASAEDAGGEGRARRSAPAASPSRRGSRDRAAGVRAREVRELLADAFGMPTEAEEPDHNKTGRQQSSASRTSEVGPPPAAPQVPRSMAAPGRDNELRRTFPAFPPRPSDGRGFAETWWGNAWVTALEEGALDPKRLARGRGYAEQGNVDAITVTPGLVLAYVQGSRPRPYRVQVRLRTLDDADWERFLDAAADRPGHIAALLDKEMPQSLAECGVPLLPGPGDLAPRCSCPDSGHPCKHAAALCYQTARLLDADPFVLLLLRGRGERELLDALSRRSAARAARAAQDKDPAPLPGVRATDALAPRALPPLPAPSPVPPHPEQPPAYPAAPGGPDPFALDQLATDAAARAHALLTTGRDPVGQLTLWQDAVRLAAARPGSGLTAGTRALYASLASAAGRTPAELARAVAAWRQGGLEGLTVLEEPWDPPAGRSTAPAPSSSPPTSPPSALGATASPTPGATSSCASAATACGTRTSPSRAATTGGPAAPPTSTRSAP
ncbi:SWIM zinc finger family protein [Streptomyces deserti]